MRIGETGCGAGAYGEREEKKKGDRMRAIDGDALTNKYGNWYVEEGTEEGFIGDLKHLIDEQPTIEPERKKGKWINKTIKKRIEYDYSCSECGRHVSVTRGYDVRLVYPFCHCGADMREGES